jgi:hypothetical protein
MRGEAEGGRIQLSEDLSPCGWFTVALVIHVWFVMTALYQTRDQAFTVELW